MSTRALFLAASALAAAATGVPFGASAAGPTFDLAAFQARARLAFPHRQAFASPLVADGSVLGFMANSLNAYETGFGEGPGTLHAAAVLYRTGVALALDDAAWRSFDIAATIVRAGDRVNATPGDGNPLLRTPRGRTIGDLQNRRASFFVCHNALEDLARRCAVPVDVLAAHVLPGMMIVPAGVAAINALQEERFTLFVASA
jgi:intracellular sulfur oxidation DsrE/DsrF family protein